MFILICLALVFDLSYKFMLSNVVCFLSLGVACCHVVYWVLGMWGVVFCLICDGYILLLCTHSLNTCQCGEQSSRLRSTSQ